MTKHLYKSYVGDDDTAQIDGSQKRVDDLKRRIGLNNGGKDLATYEPDPEPNEGPSMHDLVINDLKHHWEHHSRFVIKDVEDRKQFGLDKYGTVLQTNNGRNALVDAYQESLDLLVYMKQAMEENQMIAWEIKNYYFNVMSTATMLRKLIGIKDGSNATTQNYS